MIKIFYGEDRIKAKQEIVKFLGQDYEVIDCQDLEPSDLLNIFKGATFFDEDRRILLRDFTMNKAIYEKLPDYLDTPHKIVLLESKLDKRTSTFKLIKDKVEVREFELEDSGDFRVVFDVFRIAKKDDQKAVAMLRKIESKEEPIMFLGLMNSQAIKDFAAHQGTEEKRILKILAEVDLQIKNSTIEPWLLVEGALLRIASRN